MINKTIYSLPVTIFKDGEFYVAYTPSLDLSSAGKTPAEAQKMFMAAVDIFFEELQDLGTTDAVLSDLGWTKNKAGYWPPKVSKHAILSVKTPIMA